jgi:hypothetical protein
VTTALGATPYVHEALRWLPTHAVSPAPVTGPAPARGAADARILVADDNADMREYIGRLLERR